MFCSLCLLIPVLDLFLGQCLLHVTSVASDSQCLVSLNSLLCFTLVVIAFEKVFAWDFLKHKIKVFLFLFSSFCFWRKKALVLIHWVFCSLPLGSGGMSLHWAIKWRLNGYGLKVKAIGHIFTFSTKYLLSVCLYIRFLKQVNLSVISSSILYSHIMKWS